MSEIIFASSVPSESRRIRRELDRKAIRQLAPRIYTSNLADEPRVIIRRNLFEIAAHRFPQAVISHRSALRPETAMSEGILFLTSPGAPQLVEYPGAWVQHLKGSGPTATDKPFLKSGLFISSTARALLENCQRSRTTERGAKTLSDEELEIWLERLHQLRGAEELNCLRDDAKALAIELGMETEREKLDRLIAATLGTAESSRRHSQLGKSRAAGSPFDADRIAAFERAVAVLESSPLPSVADPLASLTTDEANTARLHRFFYDAYFSNYIEGTEFEVDEAEQIVFAGHLPANRPKDAHDITASFELLTDTSELPDLTELRAWLNTLRQWHSTLMDGRNEVRPGQFKDRANRVGTRLFVAPDLVEGTLLKAFEIGTTLSDPFARACYWKLVVTEVHPFNDGNGRISRLVLNRLLNRAQLAPVIVPNVFREDYVTALAAFTNSSLLEPLVLTLHKAQQFTAGIDFTDLKTAKEEMQRRNAFASPSEAKLIWRPRSVRQP